MSISNGSPVSRAQEWLDRCRSSDNPGFPVEKVRVGIGGSDAKSLYVGVTFLPAGTNGVCLDYEEARALEVDLLYAADAIRREQVRAGLREGHATDPWA